MSVIDKIRAKAAADGKHVVLAEGSEPRTVQAAEKIVKLGLAKITLVGAKAEIEAKAAELGVDLTGVMIVDPAPREKTASYAALLFHIREKKGKTQETATELSLLAGADRVEVTLFGNGERTGNIDILNIAYNMFSQGIDPELNIENIKEIIEVYQRCC